MRYDAATLTTHLVAAQPLPAADYEGRAVLISAGGKDGQWRVIKEATDRSLVLWGRLRAFSRPAKHFEILRRFRVRTDAPAGLGAVLDNP